MDSSEFRHLGTSRNPGLIGVPHRASILLCHANHDEGVLAAEIWDLVEKLPH